MKLSKTNDKLENQIKESIKNNYNFEVSALDVIPIGEESEAFKIVGSDENTYFVKYCEKPKVVKNLHITNALLLELADLGLEYVVKPVSTGNETEITLNKGMLYIYPFVEGAPITASNHEFPKEIIKNLTNILINLYNITSKIRAPLPIERYSYNYSTRFKTISVITNAKNDEFEKTMLQHKNKIERMLKMFNKMGQDLNAKKLKMVLTHGDVTGLNILQTNAGLLVTDWDGAMLAPKERDINFLKDNPHFITKDYLKGVKEKEIDSEAIEYYGLSWSLESILDSLEKLAIEALNPEQRREVVEEAEEYLNYY